uniref:Transmembrane protein 267 n=1 Tax=Aureoumbra lagunensis TaxID=44058 RepID=A0A7S3JZQ8_9STRA|mmetsp:Transcript_23272/g.30151  ORF Transcript_23272/g.30151 Transcript_23272/m.30151 type:complete len:280 (+) Transcript_23272:46-885(+)
MPHPKVFKAVLVCVLGGLGVELLSTWLTLPPWRRLSWRAAVDSSSHGAIGIFTWTATLLLAGQEISWKELSMAGIAAIALDLDHFLAAHSFSLFAVTRLSKRPSGHSVLAVFFLPLIGFVFSPRYALLLFVTTASHQARDALRRGFWLFGRLQTPPLPRGLYPLILLTIAATAAILLPSRIQQQPILPFFCISSENKQDSAVHKEDVEVNKTANEDNSFLSSPFDDDDDHDDDADDNQQHEESSWWWRWSGSLPVSPRSPFRKSSFSRRRRSNPKIEQM